MEHPTLPFFMSHYLLAEVLPFSITAFTVGKVSDKVGILIPGEISWFQETGELFAAWAASSSFPLCGMQGQQAEPAMILPPLSQLILGLLCCCFPFSHGHQDGYRLPVVFSPP
ncbi:hypothetical protein [Desulfogranum mediterraneum]|uniref:hypothetical protein n=1 Tax=Desulfogranum mediterraneum TaxID=160661 RepID=UPI0012948561|nr:hypothetical protein [Desulfogranum mediterraneum]